MKDYKWEVTGTHSLVYPKDNLFMMDLKTIPMFARLHKLDVLQSEIRTNAVCAGEGRILRALIGRNVVFRIVSRVSVSMILRVTLLT